MRKMQFLEEVELTFIGEHRKHGACGIHGGEPGARGRQSVVRRTGATEKLDGHASVVIYPGDIFLLETPGGGGYGTPEVEPAVGNANLQTNNS